jgi:hypothetical protein
MLDPTMMNIPPNSAQPGLANPSPPVPTFGLGLPAVIQTVFGFIWLSWGFSANAAFTDFSSNRALPAARWITFYVAFLVLLGLAIQALRRGSGRMKALSVERAEFWARSGKKLKLVSMLEGSGCALVALLCVVFHRTDLLAAGISLVVGVHFLPLARLMGFPAYYAAGIAIILCDALSIALLRSDAITFSAGVATGAILWVMAIYTLFLSRRVPPDVVIN